MMINRFETLLFTLSCSSVAGRTWRDVIDRNIYSQIHLDTERYQLKIELDPFFRVDDAIDMAPTPLPVSSTWVDAGTPSPTDSPSAFPSDMPSLSPTAPTSAPSTRDQNIDGNGGCVEGSVLYRVNMYDSWGDGWDTNTAVAIIGVQDQDSVEMNGNTLTRMHTTTAGDTTVSISRTVELASNRPFGTTARSDQGTPIVNPLGTIFEGTLDEGSSGSAFVCLRPRRCYDVVIYGGEYLDEVSWDIEPVILGSTDEVALPIVQGGAPSDCSFSIPDDDGEVFCPSTCSSTVDPKYTESGMSILENMLPVEDPNEVQVEAKQFDLDTGYHNGEVLVDSLNGSRY